MPRRDSGRSDQAGRGRQDCAELDNRHFTWETVCNAYQAIKTGSVAGKIVLDVDLPALTGE
jgi:hypothetical protein